MSESFDLLDSNRNINLNLDYDLGDDFLDLRADGGINSVAERRLTLAVPRSDAHTQTRTQTRNQTQDQTQGHPQIDPQTHGQARVVRTLTNSPGCEPSERSSSVESQEPRASRPIRHARSVRPASSAPIGSAPAPANWSRARRPMPRAGGNRGATMMKAASTSVTRPTSRTRVTRASARASDWALPF